MNRMKFKGDDGIVNEPLLEPLFRDMVGCEELLERSDTQFARRTYIRSAFAFIEGHLYWLKRIAREAVLQKGWRDNNVEIAKLTLLDDQTFKPNTQGKVEQTGQNAIPFKNNCAFIIRTIYESWDLDPSATFSDEGWMDMQDALKVRHRITHPKRSEDMEISEEELFITSESIRWLLNAVRDAVASVAERQSPGSVAPREGMGQDGV